MATQPHTVSPMLLIETPHELDFPQREAAFFYGLFLRGHSPEQLRRDISVPPQVAANGAAKPSGSRNYATSSSA